MFFIMMKKAVYTFLILLSVVVSFVVDEMAYLDCCDPCECAQFDVVGFCNSVVKSFVCEFVLVGNILIVLSCVEYLEKISVFDVKPAVEFVLANKLLNFVAVNSFLDVV